MPRSSYPDPRSSERLHPPSSAPRSYNLRPPPARGTPSQPSRTARPGPLPRPSASNSSTTTTSRRRGDTARRVGQNVLQYAGTRFLEQQQHRRASQSHHESGGSAVGHAVTSVLLEQLFQEVWEYIVRHNFFRGPRSNNSGPRAGQGDTQPSQESQMSQASASTAATTMEQRRRHRHRRRSEAMAASLDRLASELDNTYDAVIQVLRLPQQNETSADVVNNNLHTSVDALRRAITRCMARVESARRYHHRSRRTSRRGGGGGCGSASLSRSATEELRQER